jgi:hypothetical protein
MLFAYRFSLALALGLGLCGARGTGGYAQMSDAEVSAAIASAHRIAKLGERLQSVSEPFLGTPYVLGNMGEGPDGDGRDKDPRYNVKSADCTTFVEHTIAFALAKDLPEAKKLLDEIRYTKGQVGYGTRRHWPEAQWVRGLVGEGWLEEATAQIAGTDAPVEEAAVTIDPQLFAKSAHKATMPLRPEEVPSGTFRVPYIPLRSVPAVVSRLEPGLVMNVVKAPKEGLLVRISHQTMLVRSGERWMVRNASSVGKKAVVDEELSEFLARQEKARWPTVGFEFLRVKARP